MQRRHPSLHRGLARLTLVLVIFGMMPFFASQPVFAATITVDNTDSGFTKSSGWTTSTGTAGYYGSNYAHDGTATADPSKWARWTPPITSSGLYDVYMRWSAHTNRPDAAPITIAYNGGIDANLTVNQQQSGGSWVLLGAYNLAPGSYVEISAADDGYTVADAVQVASHTAPAVTFPTFSYDNVLLDPDTLNYNPTGEIIFPSVIKASDYFSNPLGTYYMYYAPHNAPGGVSLAYANSPQGPWTEYSANPIISNNWSPNYTVNHVSSPHAFWMSSVGKLYLYFHGDNTVTRVANSTDGIHFSYDKAVVDTSMFDNLTETSYARVFEYTIPSKGNTYIMLLMGNDTSDTRHIYLAWSNDGRNWTSQRTPLISPNASEGGNLSGPWFFPWQGKQYVIYHASSGNVHITEVGANFDQETHLGVFYNDPIERSAAPSLLTVDDNIYMYYERGPRLSAEIALAHSEGIGTKYEAETLSATTSSGDTRTSFADVNTSGGQGDKLTANGAGDFISYTVNVPRAGPYAVSVRVKKQNTRAIFQLSGNSTNIGTPQDTYAPSDQYTELNLGTFTAASSGNQTITFTITGKNSSSLGYTLGIDYIRLIAQ